MNKTQYKHFKAAAENLNKFLRDMPQSAKFDDERKWVFNPHWLNMSEQFGDYGRAAFTYELENYGS